MTVTSNWCNCFVRLSTKFTLKLWTDLAVIFLFDFLQSVLFRRPRFRTDTLSCFFRRPRTGQDGFVLDRTDLSWTGKHCLHLHVLIVNCEPNATTTNTIIHCLYNFVVDRACHKLPLLFEGPGAGEYCIIWFHCKFEFKFSTTLPDFADFRCLLLLTDILIFGTWVFSDFGHTWYWYWLLDYWFRWFQICQ